LRSSPSYQHESCSKYHNLCTKNVSYFSEVPSYFPDFPSTSALNRNSFWKGIKSFCLTGRAKEPDPHHPFNHDPTCQPPHLCVTPPVRGFLPQIPCLRVCWPLAIQSRAPIPSPSAPAAAAPAPASFACTPPRPPHPIALSCDRLELLHACAAAALQRCRDVVDCCSTPRPITACLTAPAGVAAEQNSD
jgi:hypothetical protein